MECRCRCNRPAPSVNSSPACAIAPGSRPRRLHPTIAVHTPLTFDIVDRWMKRSLGGCQYHVMHPGGRSYEVFPVNAFEAESRRLERFFRIGHSPGIMEISEARVDPEFPFTLDLRKINAVD